MLSVAIRLLTALVFLTAAVGKMRNWTVLQGVIANYRLLPDALVMPVSWALPVIELIVGAACLSPLASPWPELAAALLLAVFATGMAINLARGRRDIDCGCFQSTLKQTLRWPLVLRNVALIALLAVSAWDRSTVDAWALINAAIAGIALFVVVQAFNALWAIVPAPRSRAAVHRHAEG